MFDGALNPDWDMTIVDADPPSKGLVSLALGDVDGDGKFEIVVGGGGALLWYKPNTFERHVITDGGSHCGVALEDIDGDGILEAVVTQPIDASADRAAQQVMWFKPGPDPTKPWTGHVIDPGPVGGGHDILFADIDGDGQRELIVRAITKPHRAFRAYRPGKDLTKPWRMVVLSEDVFMEGTAAADVDGDGADEIVSGPYLFNQPPGGAFAGPWQRSQLAPDFREMCRADFVDVTGSGTPDVVMVESEFLDGRLAWFENRSAPDGNAEWIAHPIDRPFYYAHSLAAWREGELVKVFVAEMAEGGWDAPPNWDARLLQYTSADCGVTWEREEVYCGAGTHNATACDIDGDGQVEFVGKECMNPRVQIWKRRSEPSPLHAFRHSFIDRDKPCTGTDILAADITGNGAKDVLCARWWYRHGDWRRFEIPGIYQVHCAYDLDGDGKEEIIATKSKPTEKHWYHHLSSQLVWLKPIDPESGKWQEHNIGLGDGAWPHSTAVAPLLPEAKLALIAGYHGPGGRNPELFEVPQDPTAGEWPKRTLADIPYGEEMIPIDLTGQGRLDIVAGAWWLENSGDGTFAARKLLDGYRIARVAVADIDGDGKRDIVISEEQLGKDRIPFTRVAWLKQPDDPRGEPWPVRVVDTMRCPHSVAAADIDGDGEVEIIAGEHDKLYPYRSRSRLFVYKKADPQANAWKRFTLDDRFEHHDGAKVVELVPGKLSIVSHGWEESRYVHLWEIP